MKRLVLILSALALVAFVAIPTPAQDTIININHGRPAQTTLPPVYASAPVYAPAYAAPAPALYAGTGCRGYSAGGCHGQQAGGCQGRSYAPVAYAAPPAYALIPMQTGGCVGRTGGCQGGAMYAGGYAAVPVYGAAAYGAARGDGTFATPSGRPAPPGVVPWNGPLVGAWRAAAGYDPHYRP
jgi:hypothetical protein